MPLKFWKKKPPAPLLRRPENETDRKRLKRELAAAFARGELSDDEYENLRKKANTRMTNDQVKVALQVVGSGVGITVAITSAIAGSLGGSTSPPGPGDGVQEANEGSAASQGGTQDANVDNRDDEQPGGDELDEDENGEEDYDEDDDMDDCDDM
ncbi:hypothetical protein BWQ96_02542 [Gracilariopsis chorda]|uniref:SHOCT domain-containing protein n=1 Tax=Gracilariopsis chorda TaxID=448386 RepID=A0A2V3J2Q5_9FLOR|nr:hypothetical protein BWQ96_02542 [Gracilariopsis chorda]|eukprot:PXF47680.1 hypothetical protein BWQ96_02542 [Gracilariopsis chorda]